jgi:hypothetical protein
MIMAAVDGTLVVFTKGSGAGAVYLHPVLTQKLKELKNRRTSWGIHESGSRRLRSWN